MHWYRSKVQPGPITTNDYYEVNSRFTYCNRLIAHRGIADNSCLCCSCYERIRTPLIQAQFAPVESHFVSIGLNYRSKTCIKCDLKIVEQQPLNKCEQCINRLSQFNFYSEELGLNDQKDPEILLIKGEYY